ncbi:hypothetical protein LRE75_29105 [Streptomyces sp. 372A]
MLKCTGLCPLPVEDVLLGMRQVGAPTECLAAFPEGYALCELGEHEGDHATFVWETNSVTHGLWFVWNAAKCQLTITPWCAQEHRPDGWGSACHFFAEHPSAHSWAVRDPTQEALAADMDAHPENYGLPRHESP